MAPFPLGRVIATTGALKLLKNGEDPLRYLARHRPETGGPGRPRPSGKRAQSLKHGRRILSSYPVGGKTIWVIIEADRSVTTILLPEEY